MKKKKTSKQPSLSALVLALTATATGACTMAPPYAYLRIDAPNIGPQPAQPSKVEIVHYSQGPQQQIPNTDCNTYAATAQDSMLPPEKQTTVTVCNDGQRWVNYPAPQAAPSPMPVKTAQVQTGQFHISELLTEFSSEISQPPYQWSDETTLNDGSKLTTIVHGKMTPSEQSIGVCLLKQSDDRFAFACYVDANDPSMGTYLDGNVDLTMHSNFDALGGIQYLGKMLNGDASCMHPALVQPHEKHRKNQAYHRVARWAIRAHQKKGY